MISIIIKISDKNKFNFFNRPSAHSFKFKDEYNFIFLFILSLSDYKIYCKKYFHIVQYNTNIN